MKGCGRFAAELQCTVWSAYAAFPLCARAAEESRLDYQDIAQRVERDNLAVEIGRLATGELSAGSIAEQTRCALKNAAAIAKEAGTDLTKAVKTTIFLVDMADFAEVNGAYAEFFPGEPPARSCFAVAGLPKNARIEIETICAL